jgi:transposase-like protein
MSIDLTDPIFNDEAKAWKHFEAIRWPNGPVCPHCGVVNAADPIIGKTARHGLYRCHECRKQFTATVGTVFERSHIPMHKWLLATHLLCSSKKGMSAHQLFRSLGFGSYRTAWFMAHRIREAMGLGAEPEVGPLGGEGEVIEADTTFVGGKEKNKHVGKRNARNIGGAGKQIVHTLVERNGRARSHHIPSVSGATLRPILNAHADKKSSLMTDTAGGYLHVGKTFTRHEMVDHGADEYVRGDAYTNTVEGYFSILKRGLTGVYHSVSEAHLHRYLAEFDFRYSNRSKLGVEDAERAARALKGAEGKRLMYNQPR